jgi:putative acetyltransferase
MTTADAISISPEDPRRDDVQALIGELDAYVAQLYPPESNHLLDVETLAAPDVCFLVARAAERAIGCGALRRHDAELGEIKRMYVDPQMRGRSIGRRLLQALEAEAARQGLTRVALETGVSQPEAIALYRRAGFRDCPPFASYKPDPLSLFMMKKLV